MFDFLEVTKLHITFINTIENHEQYFQNDIALKYN